MTTSLGEPRAHMDHWNKLLYHDEMMMRWAVDAVLLLISPHDIMTCETCFTLIQSVGKFYFENEKKHEQTLMLNFVKSHPEPYIHDRVVNPRSYLLRFDLDQTSLPLELYHAHPNTSVFSSSSLHPPKEKKE